MNDFFIILEDKLTELRLERARDLPQKQKNPFNVNYDTLAPKLIPLAKILEQLVRANAPLKDGGFLQVTEGSTPNKNKIGNEYCDIILIPLAQQLHIAIVLDQTNTFKIHTSQTTVRADTLEYAQVVLAQVLAEELESMGLLDKSIYSERSQDIIEID
jgi:hypothetical protein